MGEIGLVRGNSEDISLIYCFKFNLSLNFWTDFIDFSLFLSLEKPTQFFSCWQTAFPQSFMWPCR